MTQLHYATATSPRQPILRPRWNPRPDARFEESRVSAYYEGYADGFDACPDLCEGSGDVDHRRAYSQGYKDAREDTR